MLRKRGRSLWGLSVMIILLGGASLTAGEVEKRSHTVRKGDTLWHLSESYLKDPRLWPQIWKENSYIKNPNLIYPGDPIAIPGEEGSALMEREASMGPEGAEKSEDLATSPEAEVKEEGLLEAEKPTSAPLITREVEVEKAVPKSPEFELPPYQPAPIVTQQIVADCGFIGTDGILRERRKIVKSLDPISALSPGDRVTVNIGFQDNVVAGDRFSILRPTRKVYHPLKRGRLGVLVLNVGWLEIKEAQERSSKAEVVYSYAPVEVGDRLVPYETSEFPLDLEPETIATKVKGCIVASREEKSALGARDIVYVDLGAKQGIKPGDVFSISRPDTMPRGSIPRGAQPPSTPMGELIVLRASEQTSAALISKSSGEIQVGDRVSLEKRIP